MSRQKLMPMLMIMREVIRDCFVNSFQDFFHLNAGFLSELEPVKVDDVPGVVNTYLPTPCLGLYVKLFPPFPTHSR